MSQGAVKSATQMSIDYPVHFVLAYSAITMICSIMKILFFCLQSTGGGWVPLSRAICCRPCLPADIPGGQKEKALAVISIGCHASSNRGPSVLKCEAGGGSFVTGIQFFYYPPDYFYQVPDSFSYQEVRINGLLQLIMNKIFSSSVKLFCPYDDQTTATCIVHSTIKFGKIEGDDI